MLNCLMYRISGCFIGWKGNPVHHQWPPKGKNCLFEKNLVGNNETYLPSIKCSTNSSQCFTSCSFLCSPLVANFVCEHLVSVILLLPTFPSMLTTTIHSLCVEDMADFLSSSSFTFFAHALHSHNLTSFAQLTLLVNLGSASINRLIDDFFCW